MKKTVKLVSVLLIATLLILSLGLLVGCGNFGGNYATLATAEEVEELKEKIDVAYGLDYVVYQISYYQLISNENNGEYLTSEDKIKFTTDVTKDKANGYALTSIRGKLDGEKINERSEFFVFIEGEDSFIEKKLYSNGERENTKSKEKASDGWYYAGDFDKSDAIKYVDSASEIYKDGDKYMLVDGILSIYYSFNEDGAISIKMESFDKIDKSYKKFSYSKTVTSNKVKTLSENQKSQYQ